MYIPIELLIKLLWYESGLRESLIEYSTERECKRQAAAFLRRGLELATAGRIHEAQIRLTLAERLDPRVLRRLSRKSRKALAARLWDYVFRHPEDSPQIRAMLLRIDPG